MQGCGTGDGTALGLVADMGGEHNVPDVVLAFKIIKGLYGKEYAVHPDEEGIKKQLMYPFFHFAGGDAKITIKTMRALSGSPFNRFFTGGAGWPGGR